MFDIDRIAAVIKPTEYMLRYMQSLPGARDDLQLRNLRKDCTVLLIPPFDGPHQARRYLDELYPALFENELEAWKIPENQWPQNRNLALFRKWFDIEFHSLILDIANLNPHGKSYKKID